jgi:hypothetical protein
MTDVDDNEQKRWLADAHRELALRAHDREAEFFKTNNDAAIKSGDEAVKALILINGGSSVAMLAFVGTLASKDHTTPQQIAMIASPLIWFAFGVGLAVVAACFSYLTNSAITKLSLTRERTWQHPYVKDGARSGRWQLIVWLTRMVTIVVVACSLASFGWGVWTAKRGFEQLSAASAPGVVAPPPSQTVPK